MSENGIIMLEVNGVYKHGRYGKMWWKSLLIMFNLPRKLDRQTDDMTHYIEMIDPYDTHMDQK